MGSILIVSLLNGNDENNMFTSSIFWEEYEPLLTRPVSTVFDNFFIVGVENDFDAEFTALVFAAYSAHPQMEFIWTSADVTELNDNFGAVFKKLLLEFLFVSQLMIGFVVHMVPLLVSGQGISL